MMVRERQSEGGFPPIVRPIGAGVFTGLLMILVAVLIAAITLALGWDWARWIHMVGMAIIMAGTALGGIFAGVRAGSHGWLVGALTGVVLMLVCVAVSGLSGAKGILSLGFLRGIIAVLVGAVGGVLGVNFRG